MEDKRIRNIFIVRIALWCIALGATVYWIYWNFRLYYVLGVFDVHEFATIFRPKFYTALCISIAAICLSFLMRRISDEIKRQNKVKKYQLMEEENSKSSE